jgi:hypothetical protein
LKWYFMQYAEPSGLFLILTIAIYFFAISIFWYYSSKNKYYKNNLLLADAIKKLTAFPRLFFIVLNRRLSRADYSCKLVVAVLTSGCFYSIFI